MPDDASWTDPVVVPDDLRSLQAEVDAYHREVRHAARRRRIQRITTSRAWRRLAVPALVSVTALSMATVVFVVLTFGETRGAGPARTPVAAAPVARPGEVGGLLPDVTVRSGSVERSVREVRPALVALVPLHCRCNDLLGDLAAQADESAVPLVLVAPADQDAEVDALPGRLHRGRAIPVFDAAGELARTYAASGVTVLVVAPDATVTYLQRDVPAGVRLEFPLQQMATATG